MKTETQLPNNTELGVIKIRIKSNKLIKTLTDYIYKYRHFENILLILIKQNYTLSQEGKDSNDFKYFTNKMILRNALLNYDTKNKAKSDYLNNKYKDNQLWQSLKEAAKTIKQHNFVYIIDRVKANYKTYFTNIALYKQNPSAFTGMPKPPKAKKLSKLTNYSIDIDKDNSLSFKKLKKNLIGVNLSNKMLYIHHKESDIKNLVSNLHNLYSAKVVFDNKQIYLQISYIKQIPKTILKPVKEASIDIGVNNLASVFINDQTTPSLIVDGKPYKHYNAKFNKLVSQLQEDLTKNHATKWAETKTGTKYPVEFDSKGQSIRKFISFLFSKRNRFFEDKFHKVSKRILEYCKIHNVTDIYISKNLAELKNNGDCKLKKAQKQNFIQIPFIKLLKNIEYKAKYYGINVHIVDEAYSSKTSCLSGNIKLIHAHAKFLPHDMMAEYIKTDESLANAFSGKRAKRGLFIDTKLNKAFNADLNGAVNHIKVAKDIDTSYLTSNLFKLSNPIKLKSDYEFCRLLQNSKSGKLVDIGLLQRQVRKSHALNKLNSNKSYKHTSFKQSLTGLG